jgi:hypothetical protein
MTTVLHRIFRDIVTLILMSPERISSRIAGFCLVIVSSGGNERKSGLVLIGADFESLGGDANSDLTQDLCNTLSSVSVPKGRYRALLLLALEDIG